jgi:hypothetical protein
MSTDGYGLAKNVEDMLVAELKEILLQNNLSTVGKKLELVSRLKDHLNDQQPDLKRKADDSGDENGEANKKQKTESSEHEEKEEDENNNDNNNEEEIEEVEYQEVGVQGEYQENQEYHQGNEDNEEVVVEEVGAGRELYPEEKEEQEEKERNEESQSQDGNDSKEPATSGLNKIPTLSLNNNRPGQNNQGYARLPPLRDQIKVALDEKNFEELDKLTKIVLSQNDQLNKKLTRTLQGNDELVRNFQAQGAAFARDKMILHQIIRERDEALRRLGGIPTPIRPGGPNLPPMARPPIKSAMPVPQPQPIRALPPSGQRYGQVPPVPRPTSNYPLAPQSSQQQQYASRPAYSANSYQQQQQQPSHQQYQGSYQQNQSSYQRKSY